LKSAVASRRSSSSSSDQVPNQANLPETNVAMPGMMIKS
jgi:hypothetical protein